MTTVQQRFGLTGNQLKILAMISMTCDHVGLQLLPQFPILRIIGRLALPIYAYMIAEGCRYTHDRRQYLLRLAGLGALCQVVYFLAMGSLYQCILVTFSLSASLIFLHESRYRKYFFPALLGIWFLCRVVPDLLPRTDFQIDYGTWGVLLPVFIYLSGNKGLFAGTLLLALTYGGRQWWTFAAIPLLMLYNGQRGKWKIGKLFYFYYPAHLVIIYILSLIL